jgi:hypothetical protein
MRSQLEIWWSGDKVLNVAWDEHGRTRLSSLRRPKDWIDTLLVLTGPKDRGHLKLVK